MTTTSRHFHNPFSRVREDLTSRFGGVTAFVRSPAVGLWKENSHDINREEIAMFEVLADQLDKEWWASYRKELEDKFRQEELLMGFRDQKVMNEHSRVSHHSLASLLLITVMLKLIAAICFERVRRSSSGWLFFRLAITQ
jgi:hypothetical protein